MTDNESLQSKLSRLYMNLIPLPGMALCATRKSERASLHAALLHIKTIVGGMLEDPPQDTQKNTSRKATLQILEAYSLLREAQQWHANEREACVEAGRADEAVTHAAHAAALEFIISGMQRFWESELTDA